MEIEFLNYEIEKNKVINIKIEHNKIIGLTGINNDKLINLISLNVNDINNIKINDITINKNNIETFRKRIKLVEDDINYDIYNMRTKDKIIEEIINSNIELDDYEKKIKDSLKIVGLPINTLNKDINTLSNLEKKLFILSISLLSNPSVLIIKEPFKNLDLYNTKKLVRFYNKIQERYQKTIIFISNDSDMLYQNTEKVIYAKNNKIIDYDNTNDFYNNLSKIKKYKIDIPESIELNNLIKEKKNIKLTNYKDVRDILKDIYKHV